MHVSTLHSGWEFRDQDQGPGFQQPNVQHSDWLPASVPGHVHLDLIQNGIIADPFHRQNELGVRWVDTTNWSYRTNFEWEPRQGLPNRVLRFEGLDTICKVMLNGTLIAEHDNMFVPLEVDVSTLLKSGANELQIDFESASEAAIVRRDRYFQAERLNRETQWFDERAFIRKAGYMFSWDWGPRLVSCGIWQPIRLLEFESRILSVSWHQEHLAGNQFRVKPEVEASGSASWTATFDGQAVGANGLELEGEFWWPNGMGAQKLYEAEVILATGQTVSKRVGLRTIRLVRELDKIGESFEFEVNGRKLWTRGANWIPNDSFPSQVSSMDYEAQVQKCASLGMNMLRVWGGGLYETEAFYDACDEAGLLVWQDFPFACSYYPDGPNEQAIVKAEATHHVKRLRDRACLALWCGNNENLTMFEGKWGDPNLQVPRFYGENLYNLTLPGVLEDLDPNRAYIPSSPIGASQGTESKDANGDHFGDQHYWNAWHGAGDWSHYRDSFGRFSSEFGFASSPSRDQWAVSIADERCFPEREMLWHDKTGKAWDTFLGFVEMHYPEVKSREDWVYYSQLNQRDALRFAIEFYRRSPGCAGTLIWQFNDCWPVQSWAVQDHLRLLKPAGHELRRLYSDLLVGVDPTESSLEIYVSNQQAAPFSGEVAWDLFDTRSGQILKSSSNSKVMVPAGASVLVGSISYEGLDRNSTAAQIRIDGRPDQTRWAFLAEPKEMNLVPPRLTIDFAETLQISVKGFAADLTVWDPTDPQNIFSLQDGSSGPAAFTISNGTIELGYRKPPRSLLCRSLADAAPINLLV